jgi:hypothetical protein
MTVYPVVLVCSALYLLRPLRVRPAMLTDKDSS